jgi:hypothetical protein
VQQELADFFNLHDDDFDWRKIASCASYGDPQLFFEAYEFDHHTARQVDEICLHCPVIRQCLRTGKEGGDTGVWGGIYLKNGKYARPENKHKTQAKWQQLKEIHGEGF